MKKTLLLLLMAMALLPSIIQAQTLTVADGTTTNSGLPIYGGNANCNQHTQMIYPASVFNTIQGTVYIYTITFYTTSSDSYSFPNFTVTMGEVSASNFTSNSFNTSPMTTVYTGSLTVANNRMTISFQTPYIYHGGNLLIDFSHSTSSSHSYSFQGVSATGSSIMQYSINNPSIQNFRPKLTMNYLTFDGQTRTVYVSTDGNDGAAGTSWETAKASLPIGVLTAGNNGTIFVKAGQYNTSSEINIPDGVSVLGGYAPSSTGTDTSQRHLPGTNSHWDDASYCTIINGSRTHRIASIGNGALLEGCVLQNGVTSTESGGALIDGGTLRYAVVRWCDAIHLEDGTATGGGVFIRNNGQLLNSVITECRADNGSAIAGEDGIVTNNTITRNWPANCGTVEDYDGNTYHTVIIGNQCWMRENLRCSHYADGGLIPRKTSGSTSTSPFYFYYYYTDALLVDYGYLYNWSAVMNGASSSNNNPSGVQGICPNGWHIPSKSEFEEMTNFVNSFARYRCNNGNGSIARSLASQRNWNSYSNSCCVGSDLSANNTTFFSAMPAGYYYSGTNISDLQNRSYFWTSTSESESNAWTMYLDKQYGNVQWSNQSSYYGYSVRCVKNQ